MTLEDLIYRRLAESMGLTDKLARFGDKAAVFYQWAPGDSERGWGGGRQYPRVDFVVDRQTDPERQTSGMVTLNIWCHEAGVQPEDVEPEVRRVLCDVFLHPEEEAPYCLRWLRSDSFEWKNSTAQGSHVVGVTVLFDLLAFPMMETTDPDPIMAMHRLVRGWESQATIVGLDRLPDYYTPGNEAPAVYFRLTSLSLERQTNTVAWMRAGIAGHIFAPRAAARLRWLKALVDVLALRGEVTMPDGSPMFIRSIQADAAVDYLTTGQLHLGVRFGILRRPKYERPLMVGHRGIQPKQ